MAPKPYLVLALAFGATAPLGYAEETPPRAPARLTAVSPALRERIDQLALRQMGDTLVDEVGRPIEDLPLRLLAAAETTPEDEVRLAAEAHERLLDGRPAAPTPAAARRVLDRLVAELPPHLKPDAFSYSLTVLDRPGDDAFTNGAGFVYITRPWLDALLADTDRGEAALAFVLADEIGHDALGHCRRGWELRKTAAAVAGFLPFPLLKDLPRVLGGGPGLFSYTAAEQYEADRFALHLCRNAGVDPDAAPDPLRLLAARGLNDDKGEIQPVAFRPEDASWRADALGRLKRVLMERDGLFDDETTFGLYVFDRASGKLARCGPRQVGPGERPIVLVHGLRGNEYALGDYLEFLGKRPEVAGRPLLAMRYPNDESLSRCGRFLAREMRRCVAEPDKAVFVCHSAGGLVFRWYAEVCKGGFDRTIFLAVPQAGALTADFTGFVGVGRFLLDLPDGLDYALADTFAEGDGQIAHDLHPDSLFLRRLGRETPPVARYQIFYGQFFDWLQALEVQVAFYEARRYAREAVADFVPFPDVQDRLMRTVEAVELPEEITSGDLAVSPRSARLAGVAKTTSVRAMHEEFRYDPDIMRLVLTAILER